MLVLALSNDRNDLQSFLHAFLNSAPAVVDIYFHLDKIDCSDHVLVVETAAIIGFMSRPTLLAPTEKELQGLARSIMSSYDLVNIPRSPETCDLCFRQVRAVTVELLGPDFCSQGGNGQGFPWEKLALRHFCFGFHLRVD